jgi:sulfatase maturation enzyme AslB (radical SAM superfamily)
MVESGHSEHIKIRFHTNGTQIPESFWPLVKYFKEIEMMFSIDGFGDKNYYVRYPAAWHEIEKNVDLSLKSGARTMILASLHALNVLNIDELYRWWLAVNSYDNIKYPIVLGRVYNPTYLNPQILPELVKQRTWAKIQTLRDEYGRTVDANHFRNLVENIEWMRQTTDETLETLIEYVENLDKIRNTKFDEVFVELNQLLNDSRYPK